MSRAIAFAFLCIVGSSFSAAHAVQQLPQGLTCGLSYNDPNSSEGYGYCAGSPTLGLFGQPPAQGYIVINDGDYGQPAGVGYYHQELTDGVTVTGPSDTVTPVSFVLPKGAACGFHHTRTSPGRTCMGYNPAGAFPIGEDPPGALGPGPGPGTAGCPYGWLPKRAFDMSSDYGHWVWCEYQDPNNLSAGNPVVQEGIACGIAHNGETFGQCMGYLTNYYWAYNSPLPGDTVLNDSGTRIPRQRTNPLCPVGTGSWGGFGGVYRDGVGMGWFDGGHTAGVGLGVCSTAHGQLPSPVPTVPPDCGALRASYGLPAVSELRSCNGLYRLVMDDGGSLSLYDGTTAVWKSGTYQTVARYVVMQGDGNLVIYAANGTGAIWSTGTFNHPGAYLALQDDRNLVIYDVNGAVLWASNTAVPPPPPPPTCENCFIQ